MNFLKMMWIPDMDNSSGYTVSWGVVDMTEACPRISAKQSLSKPSLYMGMPLWVPNSDFTLICLTRTFQGLGLSPHISTLAYKVPDKETQHIQFPHT